MPAYKRKRPSGGFTPRSFAYKKRRTQTGVRKKQFVPRTMGPFSQTETKYHEAGLDATAISEATTWAGSELDPVASPVNCLFAPEQGTGINQRIGRKVLLHKIAMRGLIDTAVLQDQADIVSSPAVRVIIYVDKQTNGVQSQGEDVMAVFNSGGYPSININSAFACFQNVNNFGRFQVLKDVIYTPRIVTAGTDGTNTNSMNVSQIPFKINIKFPKPLEVRFDGTTNYGSVADIVNNSVHIIAIKSGTAFASTLSYVCRSYFRDS